MNEPKKNEPTRPAPTAIDALAKIQKVLNQLDETERRKVIAFLSTN